MIDHVHRLSVASHLSRDLVACRLLVGPPDVDGHRRDGREDDLHLGDQSDVNDHQLGDSQGDHDRLLGDLSGADDHLQDVRKHDPHLVGLPGADDRLLNESQADDHPLPGDQLDDPPGGDGHQLDGSGAPRQNRPAGRDVVLHRADQCAPAELNYWYERAHLVEPGDLLQRQSLSGALPVLVGHRAWP